MARKLKSLKMINLAIANEWLTKNPFAGIKFHEVEVNKQFLSQAEINRIWQKEFKIERLELVRDVFIFCVYTGLAFIDVYNLRSEHISARTPTKTDSTPTAAPIPAHT